MLRSRSRSVQRHSFQGEKSEEVKTSVTRHTRDNFIRVIHGFHRVFFHPSDDLMACEVQERFDDVLVRQQLQ